MLPGTLPATCCRCGSWTRSCCRLTPCPWWWATPLRWPQPCGGLTWMRACPRSCCRRQVSLEQGGPSVNSIQQVAARRFHDQDCAEPLNMGPLQPALCRRVQMRLAAAQSAAAIQGGAVQVCMLKHLSTRLCQPAPLCAASHPSCSPGRAATVQGGAARPQDAAQRQRRAAAPDAHGGQEPTNLQGGHGRAAVAGSQRAPHCKALEGPAAVQ